MFDLGQRILVSQPFSVLLGAELLAVGEGRAEFRLPVRTELKQHDGFVHGGAIAAPADNALTFAGASALADPAPVPVVTAGFTIDFLRPATGAFLTARAAVVHCGRTQAVCRCDVFSSEQGADRLCAAAQGTIARFAPPSGDPGRTS